MGIDPRRLRRRMVERGRSAVTALGPAGGSRDVSQPAQRALAQQYRTAQALGAPLLDFSEAGFRVYSQMDEDGILLYLFALLGVTNKTCVELAFGIPEGANTTNLICNWGWRGVLFEGNPGMAAASRRFFARHRDTQSFPPEVVEAWVSPDNVNAIMRDHGVVGEIDLFSLDIDGADYWVWKNLDAISPRVVVVEFGGLWAPDRAVAVPPSPELAGPRVIDPLHVSASLLAYAKLGREKGYRLVGVHRQGFNAFFVRDDVGPGIFPEVTPEEIADQPALRFVARFREEHYPDGLPGEWVDV